jgi:hypothetical protein
MPVVGIDPGRRSMFAAAASEDPRLRPLAQGETQGYDQGLAGKNNLYCLMKSSF